MVHSLTAEEETLVPITDIVEELAADAIACDEANQLTAKSVALLKSTGVTRMMQPRDRGGLETHPSDYCAALIEIASHAPSAGWVAGVVGVHPWQFAWLSPRLQEEVWGEDPNTWIASPYAPTGTARRVDGGYIFNGRWQFSSGADNCQWDVLAGIEVDDEGKPIPGAVRHFVLPRADYTIVPDSWDVAGLRGTGSKDVIVKDAFVPDYRSASAEEVFGGGLSRINRPGNPLYALPFNVMFPAAVSSATIGIAKGLVDRYREYTASRVDILGVKAVEHPFRMAALGAATADIEASVLQVTEDLRRLYQHAADGGVITPEMHYAARRNQVRSVRRAYEAALMVFRHAGGTANRLDNPIQRFHRDLAIAMGHAANQDDLVYQAEAMYSLGAPIPPGTYI
ncbi:hypothetical protein [Microbacterium sp. NC79]|uniref:hypothetical protein n=1 Tax=Microbacterium sp. NC79 TaxID=2851009 RepID=UPI001C2B9C98|nr:hypothetical protein [Microbacterium sp. NC79]